MATGCWLTAPKTPMEFPEMTEKKGGGEEGSFVMLMSDFWKAPEDGLVASRTNLVIRGLELSVLPMTSLEGRGAEG